MGKSSQVLPSEFPQSKHPVNMLHLHEVLPYCARLVRATQLLLLNSQRSDPSACYYFVFSTGHRSGFLGKNFKLYRSKVTHGPKYIPRAPVQCAVMKHTSTGTWLPFQTFLKHILK